MKKKKLQEEQVAAYRRTMTQLIFLSRRAQRDIKMTMAFLTVQIKARDEDAWRKIKWVLKHLNGTKELECTLSAENMGIICFLCHSRGLHMTRRQYDHHG
jgi:hypothetical protein